MELLGIFVGDGWTRVHKASTGFSIPKNNKARKRLMTLSKKLFGEKIISQNKNEVHLYSINLARFIDSLGFGKGAKNKLIPPWVFNLPYFEKEAFIKGLMLSDGYLIGKSHRYVSASFDLLKTLRLLLQTMGYRVGKIHKQRKTKGTFVVYRQLLENSSYGYICFSKKKQPNIKKYLSQIKQRDYFADNEFFSTEKINSIKYVGEEPTLDLRVEDEHNFIADGIVVHNTGIQRSSATPFGASTKTDPAGKVRPGKQEFRKDLTKVVAAHNIPYVCQAAIHNYNDVIMKAKKGFETKGPTFMNILTPCVPGWVYPENKTVEMSRLAVDTCYWPLYEIENGVYKLNYDPKDKKLPITEWIKHQRRFKHLFKPENKDMLDKLQKHVDSEWARLKKLCGVE